MFNYSKHLLSLIWKIDSTLIISTIVIFSQVYILSLKKKKGRNSEASIYWRTGTWFSQTFIKIKASKVIPFKRKGLRFRSRFFQSHFVKRYHRHYFHLSKERFLEYSLVESFMIYFLLNKSSNPFFSSLFFSFYEFVAQKLYNINYEWRMVTCTSNEIIKREIKFHASVDEFQWREMDEMIFLCRWIGPQSFHGQPLSWFIRRNLKSCLSHF